MGPGDSQVPYYLIPTVAQSLWSTGYAGDMASYLQHTVEIAWRAAPRFDIVHAHLENHSFVFAAHCETPVVTTLHGRLDVPGMPDLMEAHPRGGTGGDQREPAVLGHQPPRMDVIHHGLPLDTTPFGPEPGDYLAFVGRVAAKMLNARERNHFREVRGLDRTAIREATLAPFSPGRMVDADEAVYRRVIAEHVMS